MGSLGSGRVTVAFVPIVDVTYGPRISQNDLERLAEALPHAVSVAVECPEEPYDGDLKPGDVELRFTALGPFDVSGLDIVVEVQSKWFKSRGGNRQYRCDLLRDQIANVTRTASVGVNLRLPVAAWSQCEAQMPRAQNHDPSSSG